MKELDIKFTIWYSFDKETAKYQLDHYIKLVKMNTFQVKQYYPTQTCNNRTS